MTRDPVSSVLILGAGINGAAIARELTLNGVSVVVVDPHDIASGATSYSSRLAHGGLRYLEYGEFDLVRESLEERNRWLRLAPHLVRPMRFVIPTASLFGGLWQAATRFFGLPAWLRSQSPRARGVWTVRLGLWFYDRFVGENTAPSRMLKQAKKLPIAPAVGRRQCEYGDAQMLYPERFTVSLFADARRAATETGATFTLRTYHQARLVEGRVEIRAVRTGTLTQSLTPSLIIDAAGSWVDEALSTLPISGARFMAGTKGSHALTSHAGLRATIGDRAVYAEARDGRPVFVLPFDGRVLIGTTDLPFAGDPSTAVADESELTYLAQVVSDLFPQLNFERSDIEQHYSGVRPLPYVGPSSPAAVTRRHWHAEIPDSPILCYAIIGGKLTTCRSLAEETTATVMKRLGLPVLGTSRDRTLTGTTVTESNVARKFVEEPTAEQLGLDAEVYRRLERFYGDERADVLSSCVTNLRDRVAGTGWPVSVVRYMIRHEWVERVEDLVERRLMLVFDRTLNRTTIAQLAEILGELKSWDRERIDAETADCVATLHRRYGKQVV